MQITSMDIEPTNYPDLEYGSYFVFGVNATTEKQVLVKLSDSVYAQYGLTRLWTEEEISFHAVYVVEVED